MMNNLARLVTASPRGTRNIPNAASIDIGAIALIRCLSILLVDPVGDFPLLDDWSFGRTVQQLLQTGNYHPLGFGVMTLFTNVLWGALFCLPSGFSFTALRISTLVASLLGVIGAYALACELRQPRWTAIVIATMLAFDPFYYVLSNTFMTDVGFCCLILWSIVFLSRSLREESRLQLLLGTVASVAAVLSRQLALCVPLAFALVLLLVRPISSRRVRQAIFPFTTCIAAFFGFKYWLKVTGLTPAQWNSFNQDLLHIFSNPGELVHALIDHGSFLLLNLGLLLLPITPLLVKAQFVENKSRAQTAACLGIVCVGILIAMRIHFGDPITLPVHDNVLVKSGLGPTMLRDAFFLQLDNMQGLPSLFWIVVTMLSLIGSVALVSTLYFRGRCVAEKLLSRGPTDDIESKCIFLLICCTFYVVLLLPAPFLFDRYVIPLIPLLALGLGGLTRNLESRFLEIVKPLQVTTLVLLVAFSVYAVAGTRDYLSWNRVRWNATRSLMSDEHIDPKDIDGGFEFNGFYLFDPSYKEGGNRSWWWVDRDKYQIAFGPVPGYHVFKEYTYFHWLPPHLQRVVVLKKE